VFKTIRHLLELIRFSHTIFVLPFALLAAVMAWRLEYFRDWVLARQNAGQDSLDIVLEAYGEILSKKTAESFGFDGPVETYIGFAVRWQEIVGILLCMVAARSFAMAFNRLADRRLDAANPRTAGRHLPAGILSVGHVTVFAAVSASGFVASTLLFLPNQLPLILAVPVLAFLAGYSYTKRFTSLAHFWLGAALALSPVAAWIAIRGETVMAKPADLFPALVLGGAVLTWVAGFDMIYACQDYDADRKAKLHSVPVKLGIPGALRGAMVCHFLTVVLLAALPLVYPFFGWIYWLGVSAVAILLVYEHAIVRPDDLSRVNAAFFNVNAVISLGLFAVGTLDLWVGGG
jgi:4-hydroxybenzoate polyprenyltransferase